MVGPVVDAVSVSDGPGARDDAALLVVAVEEVGVAVSAWRGEVSSETESAASSAAHLASLLRKA
jgi:hypothetical protein